MSQLLVSPATNKQLQTFKKAPAHALILSGPKGAGKFSLAVQLAADLLEIETDKVESHSYVSIIKSAGIEEVREIEHFLSLKVPSKQAINRVIIIEDAQTLKHEAQNALLKTLEEPPDGTVLILTTSSEQALLPTIRSRAQSIAVTLPQKAAVEAYFASQSEVTVEQAYRISGGLPGLMSALLSEQDHPLLLATTKARELLAHTGYQRLLQVDSLAKDKVLAQDVTFIMQQMAHVSLQKATGTAATKWQQILGAAYDCNQALATSAQPKLALTNLMLSF